MGIQIRRAKIDLIKDEEERAKQLIQLEQELLNSKIATLRAEQISNLEMATTTEQEKQALEANAQLETQIELLKEESHTKEMKRSESRIKANEKENKSRLQLAQTIMGTFSSGAKATSELIQTLNKENKEAALIAFRINQAAALADLAGS